MSRDHEVLLHRLRDEGKIGGLIVRFDKHGVLVMCTPELGPIPAQQPELPVDPSPLAEGANKAISGA